MPCTVRPVPHSQHVGAVLFQSRKRYVTLSTLILFTLFALILALFIVWRRGRWIVAAAALALFWLLSSGWLTAGLLDLAQPEIYRSPYDHAKVVQTTFTGRTAIVVLGGGTVYGKNGRLVPKRDVYARLATAAALYAQCRQQNALCHVIVSGGNPQRHPASEADTYAPYLLRAHVASTDLVLDNTSLTTWQNARNVARILNGELEHDDTIMVVTSAYHMRRAMLCFHRFGLDPVPIVSQVRHAQLGWLPRLRNLESAQTALHELIGTALFHAYRIIGWY